MYVRILFEKSSVHVHVSSRMQKKDYGSEDNRKRERERIEKIVKDTVEKYWILEESKR